MRRAPLIALAVYLCACQMPGSTSAPTATPSAAPIPAREAASFLESPGRPIASPDGKLIVIVPNGEASRAALVFDRAGTKVGEIADVAMFVSPEWLPDSGGLIVARGTRTAYTLEIVERDLRVTPTGLSGGAPSSLRPSPDGRVVAVETTEEIWTFSRDKPSAALPLAGTKGRHLVGWDANAHVLVREGNSVLTALTSAPPLALPADLETDPKISFTFATSPDRTVNVIGTTRNQGRGVYVSAGKVIDGRSPQGWVGDHSALVHHDGKVFVFDAVSGDEKAISVPDRARILAATTRDVIWGEGDEVHVTDVKDGSDRMIVGAQSREAFYVPLGTDGLLIYSLLNKKAWLVELHPRSA